MKYGQTCRPALAERLRQIADVLEGQELDDLMEEVIQKVKAASVAAGIGTITATIEAVNLSELTITFGELDRDVVIGALMEYGYDGNTSPISIVFGHGGDPFPVRIDLGRMLK